MNIINILKNKLYTCQKHNRPAKAVEANNGHQPMM